MNLNVAVVKQLIAEQFPQWKSQEIKPVQRSGHDNRTFHLGDEMAIRMPSGKAYVPQVEKEAKWLPFLAKKLSLPITEPIAQGEPAEAYPYVWSVNKWLDGETVQASNVNWNVFAKELACFLKELESIDASTGPAAGTHNFYRGGDLAVYEKETKQALFELKEQVDTDACALMWKQARATKWNKQPVWVHGDVAQGIYLFEMVI